MSRINQAFQDHKAFIAFLTAGDPTLEKSEEYILTMVEAGADLIEIGIPFSDPIAEGVVIQDANIRALSHGCTTDQVFELVAKIRQKTQVPICFLCYLNSVFKYGYERFFTRCEEVGVDGMIIPDMPYEEKGEAKAVANAHGVDIISLIAPTSEQRIRMIASEGEGFLYIVSSLGVTGVRAEIKTDLASILAAVKEATDVPAAVGFGIHSPEQARAVCQVADGAIVGSAIVKIIEQYGENAAKPLYDYVKSMKEAVLNV